MASFIMHYQRFRTLIQVGRGAASDRKTLLRFAGCD
jgi:hypothetical protein